MHFLTEQARTQSLTAPELISRQFGELLHGALDAEFFSARRDRALGFAGLPYETPVCACLLNEPVTADYLDRASGSQLFMLEGERLRHWTKEGETLLPPEVEAAAMAVVNRLLSSPGRLNEKGELLLDLKAYPVGPHYPVNLLLGNRAGYPHPLCTTPKSALDSLGRGSFRATGGQQVLATRCVLDPSENGEPANRQFYLVEDGKQIFYSADAETNVASASCLHSQNRTVITYETDCGLKIRRTIFLLPQEDGMPNAVEAQRVEIVNRSGRDRKLKIVMTGVFGIAAATGIANDVIYCNVVAESELYYQNDSPAALTLHHKPAECAGEKRFAALLCNGEGFDEFCTSQSDFIGRGTLAKPELVSRLPSRHSRKLAPFFALGKTFNILAGETAVVDELVGMMETEGAVEAPFDEALHRLLEKYRDPAALRETFQSVVNFWDRYPAYLRPRTGNERFDAYVGRNLPFQVLYQTYVSRAVAWTQKSYRETGFREIQDIYASMYYLSALGENDLVKDLLSNWVRQVWRMGYAYHDFTFQGKEPGDCSDDQLWLVQAVYRYVKLTGDRAFLLEEFPIAGEEGAARSLWETIMAILTYSGSISVGAHGLPLLDKADWNDTLRLDPEVMKGPEKERRYRKQLEEKGQTYGVPLENTLCETVMNACLLKIAADEAAELAGLIEKTAGGQEAAALSRRVYGSMQENAWKGDFFARCLINDQRPYKYLGAKGDGLSLDPDIDGSYYLNSYSWSILSDTATEEQIGIMLGVVEKYLKTEAGLKLCTLVNYDLLEVATGTALYFPGDRENGGVFKHAAIMAAVASLRAAKSVKDEALAKRLAELAFFMIDRTLPYRTLENPFVLKGNPRFCTQYNNSETGENIGPMLSGTASWLTLAIFAFFGMEVSEDSITVSPILRPGETRLRYTMQWADSSMEVEVESDGLRFRVGAETAYLLDENPVSGPIPRPTGGGTHLLRIRL